MVQFCYKKEALCYSPRYTLANVSSEVEVKGRLGGVVTLDLNSLLRLILVLVQQT